MNNFLKIIGGVVLVVILIAFLGILFAFPTMWLWNWLMPPIFKFTTITVWQAWGLNVLTGLFFRTTNPKFNNEK